MMIAVITAFLPFPFDMLIGKSKSYSECTPAERRKALHGVIPCCRCDKIPHKCRCEWPDDRQR
jgi:hypothetical protein